MSGTAASLEARHRAFSLRVTTAASVDFPDPGIPDTAIRRRSVEGRDWRRAGYLTQTVCKCNCRQTVCGVVCRDREGGRGLTPRLLDQAVNLGFHGWPFWLGRCSN
jgi:hypothetical protein